MAEPVSVGIGIAAGVLAFVQVALAESKWLYTQFSSLTSHKAIVADFLRELKGLEDVLGELEVYIQGPMTREDEARLGPIRIPLRDCAELLETLTQSYKTCDVQNPQSRRENFSRWLKMQYKGKSMEDAYKHLQSKKATLVIALAFITLRDGGMTQSKLDDLKSDISSYQADMIDSLEDLDTRITSAADATKQDLEAYKRELEATQQLLRAAAEATAMTKPAPSMVIEGNVVDQASRQVLGTDTTDAKYDLTARENTSRNQSVQMIGNYRPESIRTVINSLPPSTTNVPIGMSAVRLLTPSSRSSSLKREPAQARRRRALPPSSLPGQPPHPSQWTTQTTAASKPTPRPPPAREPGTRTPAARPICGGTDDCLAYCQAALGATPYGTSVTCSGTGELAGEGLGRCSCIAMTADAAQDITNAFVAIGEVACVVLDEALALTPTVLQAVGAISRSTELKWAAKIFKIGVNLMAHGAKLGRCANAACPGHQSVAIDPERLEEGLSWLDVC
ncbi:hypothetical protein LTR53_000811 [Teratosphaeriaceae sp. CCFEE 6253]|nr:hypothetical protein LTR53_000811 [Teratosphaeriaceae sp. CCFEE 6253]